jgi:hypothetical protein
MIRVSAAMLSSHLPPAKPPVPRPAKDFTCTDSWEVDFDFEIQGVVLIQFLLQPALPGAISTADQVADYGPQGFQASAWHSTTRLQRWCGAASRIN